MSDTSWINITIAGTTAGLCVASAAFTAGSISSRILASSAGRTIDAVGQVASAGTKLLLGPAAGLAVRIATESIARTTEATVSHTGQISTGVMAAAAGAITALTITVGTRLIEYTVEYGGKLSHDVALKMSETYLKYKAMRAGFPETGDLTTLVDNDWVLVEDSYVPVGDEDGDHEDEEEDEDEGEEKWTSDLDGEEDDTASEMDPGSVTTTKIATQD